MGNIRKKSNGEKPSKIIKVIFGDVKSDPVIKPIKRKNNLIDEKIFTQMEYAIECTNELKNNHTFLAKTILNLVKHTMSLSAQLEKVIRENELLKLKILEVEDSEISIKKAVSKEEIKKRYLNTAANLMSLMKREFKVKN